MIKKTTKLYDENDIALLQQFKSIPDNPCCGCRELANGSCCGCPEGNAYAAAVKPYKIAGIYEDLHKLKRYDKIVDEINSLELEAQDIRDYYNEVLDVTERILNQLIISKGAAL